MSNYIDRALERAATQGPAPQSKIISFTEERDKQLVLNSVDGRSGQRTCPVRDSVRGAPESPQVAPAMVEAPIIFSFENICALLGHKP